MTDALPHNDTLDVLPAIESEEAFQARMAAREAAFEARMAAIRQAYAPHIAKKEEALAVGLSYDGMTSEEIAEAQAKVDAARIQHEVGPMLIPSPAEAAPPPLSAEELLDRVTASVVAARAKAESMGSFETCEVVTRDPIGRPIGIELILEEAEPNFIEANGYGPDDGKDFMGGDAREVASRMIAWWKLDPAVVPASLPKDTIPF